MTRRKITKGQSYNDLQNTTQKIKDRATQTPQKSGCELRRSGGVHCWC